MIRRFPALAVPLAACVLLALAAGCALSEDGAAQTDGEKAPEPAWNVARLEALVARMRSTSFTVRDNASLELAVAPPSMLPSIRVAVNDERDPEVRERLVRAGRVVFMDRVLPDLAEWKIGRGFLGIQWTISYDPPGILVQEPIDGTGAANAGVRARDIIVAVDDIPCEEGFSQDSAINIWKGMAPGDPMKLRIRRGDKEIELNATVGERPAEYASPRGDDAKADQLWAQFLEGTLVLPAKMLQPATSEGHASASANGSATSSETPALKASQDIQRRRTQVRPVQSWPKEMEGD